MKFIKKNIFFLTILFGSLFLTSCIQDNLDPDNAPGVGEVTDLTPPEASFSSQQDAVDFTTFLFINESVSFTGQTWTIPEGAVLVGDEASLNDQNITVKFPSEGVYEVSLVAEDDRPSVSASFVELVDVVEPEEPIIPVPEILSPGFEDYEGGDGRNAWGRNNSANTGLRIASLNVFGRSTGSRVRSGNHSAKFEDNSPRQAYQEIEVTPNANYRLSAYIKLGSSVVTLVDNDEFRLAVLGETFTTFDLTSFEDAIIESATADPTDEFARISVIFNAGDKETVVIYMDSKSRNEVQVDDVEIEVL